MSNLQNANVGGKGHVRRRPGPFGPASALLPVDQKVLSISDDTLASDALERMVDSGYSQLPVKNADGDVIGVFSWQSFGKRVSELHATSVKVTELRVKDTDLEKARFISPETYIDTETDWGRIDYVIVGSPDQIIGVLTITDVFARLNDFAEAFVLLFEIETEIRDLIVEMYSSEELVELCEGLSGANDGPKESAIHGLQALIHGPDAPIDDDKISKSIQFAANLLKRSIHRKSVTGLEDFTFAQYREVIFNRSNWARFEIVFEAPRDLVNIDFEKINELRNIVFHFRRGVTATDTDRLRRFRDKLRYNRDLYHRKQATLADSTNKSVRY